MLFIEVKMFFKVKIINKCNQPLTQSSVGVNMFCDLEIRRLVITQKIMQILI